MAHRNHPTARHWAQSDLMPAPAEVARQGRNRDDVRASIAQVAARLIADGLTDYRAAKHKAARQLGLTDSHALPDNQEIESALRERHALFAHETQPRTLSALRDTAVRAMLRLEQYSPWLVGAVLNGTANEFSEIELELVGVEPKDFEMYLLNSGAKFSLCDMPAGKGASPGRKVLTAHYRLEFDGATINIALYKNHAARQATQARDSIRRDRMQRAEAGKRFNNERDTS